jgi:hypothetical protein
MSTAEREENLMRVVRLLTWPLALVIALPAPAVAATST